VLLTTKLLELINAAQNIVPDSIAGNKKYSVIVIVVEELFISVNNMFGIFSITLIDGVKVGLEEISKVFRFVVGTEVGNKFERNVENVVRLEVEIEVENEVGNEDGVVVGVDIGEEVEIEIGAYVKNEDGTVVEINVGSEVGTVVGNEVVVEV
jgi:hypothetical protein